MSTAALTLQDALQLYIRHSPDLSNARRKNLEATLRRWGEAGGNSDVGAITTTSYADFRRYELALKLSPVTIEHHVNCLRALLRHIGPQTDGCPHGLGLIERVPWVGKRLRHVPTPRPAVSLSDLSAVYSVADQATRPRRKVAPLAFWRAFLAISFYTGLRIGDLLGSLRWTNYDIGGRCLTVVASKTGKRHRFPVNDTLAAHLDALPRSDERVLPVAPTCDNAIRRQLRVLCAIAGVPVFTPQSIRRRAATEYERAHPGSGALLLGHILPGMAMTWQHYCDPLEILRAASAKVAHPIAFRSSGK